MKPRAMTRFGLIRSGWTLRRPIAFAAVPLLSAASPLLVFPAISRWHGTAGLASFAVGQAAGSIAAVVVELGWGLTGPVAAAAGAGRTVELQRLVSLSLATRGMMFVVAGPTSGAVAFMLAPSNITTAVLSAVAFAANGVSLSWFYIGLGRPGIVTVCDGLTRLAAAAVGVVLITLRYPLWTYPAVLLAAAIIGVVVAFYYTRTPISALRALALRSVFRGVVSHSATATGRLASTVYIFLPSLMLALVSPSAVSLYAVVDRLLRSASAVLVAVPNSMHSWLGSALPQKELLRSRLRTTIVLNTGVGVAAGAAFAAVGPPLARHMLTRTEVPSLNQSIYIASAILTVTCISRGTGSVALVHLGQTRWITLSAISGAVLCTPVLWFLASAHGSAGAFGAVLFAETIVLTVQVSVLIGCRDRVEFCRTLENAHEQ